MKTEIQKIKEALHYWQYGNKEQFIKAEKVLKKYHDKYGTVDLTIIKQLIN